MAFSSQRTASYRREKDGVRLLAPVLFLQLGLPESEEAARLLPHQFEGGPAVLAGDYLALDGVGRDRYGSVTLDAVDRRPVPPPSICAGERI
jgi:hypothetical protein